MFFIPRRLFRFCGTFAFAILIIAMLAACASNESDPAPDGDGADADREESPDGDADLDDASDGDADEIEGSEDDGEPDAEPLPSCSLERGFDAYYGSLCVTREATGFFRVEKIGEQWWLFTPDGHPFFSAGINVVNFDGTATHDGVKHYREAALAKYGDEETWADAQIPRLEAWGWNTIGAWSGWRNFQGRFPYTVKLNLAGANMTEDGPYDYFSESFHQRIADAMANEVPGQADDPYLIGYFLDNELHWGRDHRGDHLFDEYMHMDAATSTGKQRLLAFLEETYETMDALKEDFDTESASFSELAGMIRLPNKETEGALATKAAWTGLVAEEYFRVSDETLAALDPDHLNLGVRFVSQMVPRAAIEAAGRYVDVMSINFYDMIWGIDDGLTALDPDYLSTEDFLKNHYEAGGRPVLVSEWSYRADDSGLPNSYPPIYPTFDTQEERTDAFAEKYQGLLDRTWFVGQHWFLFADQPPEGRFDGEDSNFGLVTEQDAPYELLLERSAAMIGNVYKRLPDENP